MSVIEWMGGVQLFSSTWKNFFTGVGSCVALRVFCTDLFHWLFTFAAVRRDGINGHSNSEMVHWTLSSSTAIHSRYHLAFNFIITAITCVITVSARTTQKSEIFAIILRSGRIPEKEHMGKCSSVLSIEIAVEICTLDQSFTTFGEFIRERDISSTQMDDINLVFVIFSFDCRRSWLPHSRFYALIIINFNLRSDKFSFRLSYRLLSSRCSGECTSFRRRK